MDGDTNSRKAAGVNRFQVEQGGPNHSVGGTGGVRARHRSAWAER
jgi:hypothetical protein